MKRFIFPALLCIVLAASCKAQDGIHQLHILSTNDVHGCYFDESYTGGPAKRSLFAVKYYADSVRSAVGADNVLLLDAGDCLQGDNAAYYFNYVDTLTPHVYPRLASYIGYDAIAVGNHDIETGHAVYDRITRDLRKAGIPFLAGNAVRTSDGKPYFEYCKIFRRAGLKVAVLGYTNANIKAWLDESIWSGMDFKSLLPLVQKDVDAIRKREKPDAVVVVVHSGSGKGDGSLLESQGRDLLNSLRGVDFVVNSHDHHPVVEQNGAKWLLNSGSHCRNVAHGVLTAEVKKGKVVSKTLSGELIAVDASKADPDMREAFSADFEAVKAFTLREVGTLERDILTREAYKGMSDYTNLIHTVCLKASLADISMAAPLTYNGTVKAGKLIYNDLFTIYPYENQMFVVKMTGREILAYLEYSYANWIHTVTFPSDRVLNIAKRDDPRTGQKKWSFVARSYNFDSAAGICYTVDITKPAGSRVSIQSLASGAPFDPNATYTVAMTSYRANGGGGIMPQGAGIVGDALLEERIIGKYPEIRNLIYDYIVENGGISVSAICDPSLIGSWSFVPTPLATKTLSRDYSLLFGE